MFRKRSAPIARLAYGLIAFLLANLAVFVVATQVFGDVFVLIILGMLSGFFRATPNWPSAKRFSRRRRDACPDAPGDGAAVVQNRV
jgi:hypothetical protein